MSVHQIVPEVHAGDAEGVNAEESTRFPTVQERHVGPPAALNSLQYFPILTAIG